MKPKVGLNDRIVRAIIGPLVLAAMFGGPLSTYLTVRILIGLVGIILIATSVFGYCPADCLFGFKT